MSRGNQSYPEERQRKILEILDHHGRVDVDVLIEELAVSRATIRRDLANLEQQNHLRRTHGGAIPVKYLPDSPLDDRKVQFVEEKKRIGQLASHLISDGETIFIAAGTTTLQVAIHLNKQLNLTVITNSIPVFTMLTSNSTFKVFMIGGQLRDKNAALVGTYAVSMIQQFSADKVILGTSAINLDRGVVCMPDAEEANVQRAMIQASTETLVVTDHSKFNQQSPFIFTALAAVHTIVTDSAIPQEAAESTRRHGVNVMRAL